jgi:Ca2+-transporting ATPase
MPSAFHAVPVDAVLSELGSNPGGLTDDEARARLARFGPNRLELARPVSVLAILRDQLRSVVVALLFATALISLLLGDRLEAIAIAAVLVINTMIGFLTEWRARRSMDALLRLDVSYASVLRGGRLLNIDAAQLVPGDVIEIDPGDRVPGDARVIDATDLRTTEAALTGESLPVSKSSALVDADTPLADRRNMVYKGTSVAAGTGRAVVTGTGVQTELGRVGTMVASLTETRTPLENRLDDLGRRLVWLALAVAALVAAVEAARGSPVGLVIQIAIALAVAAVPESLPAVATIALAVGMRRMARRNVLVRRLPVVETLGSTTVVCSDKTRTLTSGIMTVVWAQAGSRAIHLTEDGAGRDSSVRRLLSVAALASRPQAVDADGTLVGDPVDVAVLAAAERAGIVRDELVRGLPVRDTLPFSSSRKLMASFRADPAGHVVAFVKGAPGRVLDLCGSDRDAEGRARPLDATGRATVIHANERLAGGGLRVLAAASGVVEAPTEADLRGLTFEGLLGLADPPAPGVKETIARLRQAGLRTVMITGDQRRTAAAIGLELGLLGDHDQVIDGSEIDALDTREREEQFGRAAAFSRVTPEHKLAIVGALQTGGQIVAMLGDGVNDAAALKKADVGVAMGLRGTDVAKEAAAIVLQDDRFESVAAAVEEGRVIFDNIRKFIFYLFSCNVAEILVLLVAGLAGLPPPLRPLQLLWLNIVTDTFPALALAMEPGDPDVMRRPPRDPDEALLSRSFLKSVLSYGAILTASPLAAYVWALEQSPDRAQTIAFMTLALAQIFHLGNARSTGPVLRPVRAMANVHAIAAVILSVMLQVAAIQIEPIGRVLRVLPLDLTDWILVTIFGALPAVAGQSYKLLRPARQVDSRPGRA